MSPTNAERRRRRDDTALVETIPSADIAPGAQSPMLEEVYRQEAPRLARYFRSRLRPGEEAADLVQEAFVRLAGFMSSSTLPRPGAYLQRIARNLLDQQIKIRDVTLRRVRLVHPAAAGMATVEDELHDATAGPARFRIFLGRGEFLEQHLNNVFELALLFWR